MMNLLLAWFWQGLLVALVATIAVRLVPAGAAARRHAIWWLALVLIVALPIVPSLVDAATNSVPSRAATLATTASIAAPDTTGTFVFSAPPAWVASALLALWGVIAVVGLVRIGRGLRSLRALTRSAHPMDPAHEARLTRWMAARNTSRPARLRVSDQIRGACAVGFLEPTLLVSSDLVITLDDEALEAIVLHEFAHLERYDDWTGLLQRIFLAVGGFHAALWWISRQIDIEREVACDQRVILRTGAPVLYARSLADAATIVARGHGQTPALAPGASTGMLHARVKRLLRRSVANRHLVRLSASAATFGLCVTTVVLGQARGLVAFATLPPFEVARLSAANLPLALVGVHPGAAGVARSITNEGAIEPTTLPAQPPAVVIAPTPHPSPVGADRREVVAGVESAVASGGDADAVALPSTPLAMANVLPGGVLPATVTYDAPALSALGQPFANIGTAVSAAGVATGQGAGRAGASIGKWFKNRGADVARTF